MLSRPPPDEPRDAQKLRGDIFTDLDQLAFALEMEAAELLSNGDADAAAQRQSVRLGVRLAQRLVTGHWADEVNLRIQNWSQDYEARLQAAAE